MKIRTTEELTDKLNEDRVWRKKEIHYLLTQAEKAKEINQKYQIRAGIAILYAHWEGFIKNASELYLIYVKTQRNNYSDLIDNFLAIRFHNKIKQCLESSSLKFYHSVISEIRDVEQERVNFTTEGVVKTDSNLNSDILESILTVIGFNPKQYELKHKLIDEVLLKKRNEIVHGEHSTVDIQDFVDLKLEIVDLIDQFCNEIIDAAILKKFER